MPDKSKNAQRPEAPGSGEPESVTLRVADTIEAAAGMTDYSVAFLQRLKASGCPAFRNGRVYVDELETYYAEHQAMCSTMERECEEVEALDAEIRRERVRKLRFDNDVREGKFVARETIERTFQDLAESLNAALGDLLEGQLPPVAAGKSEEEIRAEARRIRDEICRRMEAGRP